MSRKQGKAIEPSLKKAIVSVKEYFDRNKGELKIKEPSDQVTADVLGVGVASVRRVMADYKRSPGSLDEPPALRGRPNFSVDSEHYEVVRKYVRQANSEGTYLTLQSICDLLQKHSPREDFNTSTLSRTLDRWGFSFGEGTRTMHLKEKDYIVASRRRYLRRMRKIEMKRVVQFALKSILMNPTSIRIIAKILRGILVKMVHGFKNQQEKVTDS